MEEAATQVAQIAWQHSRGAGRGRGTRYSTATVQVRGLGSLYESGGSDLVHPASIK